MNPRTEKQYAAFRSRAFTHPDLFANAVNEIESDLIRANTERKRSELVIAEICKSLGIEFDPAVYLPDTLGRIQSNVVGLTNPYSYVLSDSGAIACQCGKTTNIAYKQTPNLICWSCGKLIQRTR